jgi:hypothetical protein
MTLLPLALEAALRSHELMPDSQCLCVKVHLAYGERRTGSRDRVALYSGAYSS